MNLNSGILPTETSTVNETRDVENRSERSRSVHWEDQELMNVVDFSNTPQYPPTSADAITIALMAPESKTQELVSVNSTSDVLPLLTNLAEMATEEMNSRKVSPSVSSRSVSSSIQDSEQDDEKQAALADLITHLEDTAALLREHLAPPSIDLPLDIASAEQINFILRYQLLLVFFCQTINILLLTLFDHLVGNGDSSYSVLSRSTGTVLQIVNMLLVTFATVVLSKQMLKYKVEGSFLAQTYLSTVMTFAGLYFMIYRFKPDSWEFEGMDRMEESIAVVQFIRMLYLSVSAATLCGAANIQPRDWYVTLILCFQSLVNFVYFASILAQTIGNYHSYTVQVRRSESMSRISQLARNKNDNT